MGTPFHPGANEEVITQEILNLLQRVRVLPFVGKSESKSSTSGGRSGRAQRRGIRAASFRERSLRDARAQQQRRQPVIPLLTPRLIVDAIRRVALLLQLLFDGPRSGPRRRI